VTISTTDKIHSYANHSDIQVLVTTVHCACHILSNVVCDFGVLHDSKMTKKQPQQDGQCSLLPSLIDGHGNSDVMSSWTSRNDWSAPSSLVDLITAMPFCMGCPNPLSALYSMCRMILRVSHLASCWVTTSTQHWMSCIGYQSSNRSSTVAPLMFMVH